MHPDATSDPSLSGFNDDTSFDVALRAMSLDGHLSTDLLRHTLEPLIDAMPSALTEVVVHAPGDAESVARSLLNVWLAGLSDDDSRLATASIARAIEAVTTSRAPTEATALLRAALARDAARLPAALAAGWQAALTIAQPVRRNAPYH